MVPACTLCSSWVLLVAVWSFCTGAVLTRIVSAVPDAVTKEKTMMVTMDMITFMFILHPSILLTRF